MSETKYILSIDGGGMKGMIPALILAELELRTGKPCSEMFDMVSGTSIGGILACLIAAGFPAKKCVSFFSEHGPKIFGRKRFLSFNGLNKPRYSAGPLEAVLKSFLGSSPMEKSPSGPHCIVTAYDVQSDEPYFIRTWGLPPAFAPHTMVEAARATSAAQTYFPAVKVFDQRHGINRVLWDGGVTANNPSNIASGAARKLWPDSKLVIFSVGCISTKKVADASDYIEAGLIKAAVKTLAILFNTNASVPDYILEQLKSESMRYRRVCATRENLKMDGASPRDIEMLQLVAHETIEENSDRLDEVAGWLLAKGS